MNLTGIIQYHILNFRLTTLPVKKTEPFIAIACYNIKQIVNKKLYSLIKYYFCTRFSLFHTSVWIRDTILKTFNTFIL
jgi:hypothetical protein